MRMHQDVKASMTKTVRFLGKVLACENLSRAYRSEPSWDKHVDVRYIPTVVIFKTFEWLLQGQNWNAEPPCPPDILAPKVLRALQRFCSKILYYTEIFDKSKRQKSSRRGSCKRIFKRFAEIVKVSKPQR